MVILNLFIGVIMNSIAEAQVGTEERTERERSEGKVVIDAQAELERELAAVERRLEELQRSLRAIAAHARAHSSS